MKTIFFKFSIFLLVLLFVSSCKKEYDIPPVKPIGSGSFINIAGIKAKYSSNINYTFKGDSNLYCVITADEVSGNLYKDIYVKDATGGLHVKLISSGGLFVGDSIRINLKGAILNEYNKLIQLDSVDTDKSIVKLASGYNPQPAIATIDQISASIGANGISSFQSKLIKIENVEFSNADQNQLFADPIGKASMNRILKSCSNKTLTVRTSGYSNFAAKTVPSGNGSIIGIVSQFGTTMQFTIRNYNEVNMNGALCSATSPTSTPTPSNSILIKDFNDNSISSGGWTSYTVTNGSVKWAVSTFSSVSTPFAKISGYVNSANSNSESWLISPTMDLSSKSNPVLSFNTAAGKFAGPPLDILVSTNYSSGAPSTATWTSIGASCVLSPTTTSYVWTPSGNASLNSFKTSTTRVAFKYTSTTSGATTYELDDIVVKEN